MVHYNHLSLPTTNLQYITVPGRHSGYQVVAEVNGDEVWEAGQVDPSVGSVQVQSSSDTEHYSYSQRLHRNLCSWPHYQNWTKVEVIWFYCINLYSETKVTQC